MAVQVHEIRFLFFHFQIEKRKKNACLIAPINTFISEDLNKMLQKMTTIIKSHGNKASVPTLNQLLLTMSYPYLSTEFIKIVFFRDFF